MADGPEDQVLESIWTGERQGQRFAIRVGGVVVPFTHWFVWFPYLVLLVVFSVGLIVFLPADLAADFLSFAFDWVGLFRGNVTVRTLGSLLGVTIGLVLSFVVYTQLFRLILAIAAGERGR